MSEPKLSERICAAGNEHLEAWTEAMMPLQWADEVAALEAELEKERQAAAFATTCMEKDQARVVEIEADNAALRKRVEGLAWAIQLVLRDFEDNNSPCLSIAAVNAVQAIEAYAREK